MTLTTLVLLCGAVARVTRLVVDDSILDAPRDRLLGWLEPRGDVGEFLVELLSCSWCASIWIAFPAAAVAWRYPVDARFVVPAAALTASAVAGWLGSHD